MFFKANEKIVSDKGRQIILILIPDVKHHPFSCILHHIELILKYRDDFAEFYPLFASVLYT